VYEAQCAPAAAEITQSERPVSFVLAVMGAARYSCAISCPGCVPLESLHPPSRYGNDTSGGKVVWTVARGRTLKRTVSCSMNLDGGERSRRSVTRELAGAAAFYSAVLTDKNIGRDKPIGPDSVRSETAQPLLFGLRNGCVRAGEPAGNLAVKDPERHARNSSRHRADTARNLDVSRRQWCGPLWGAFGPSLSRDPGVRCVPRAPRLRPYHSAPPS